MLDIEYILKVGELLGMPNESNTEPPKLIASRQKLVTEGADIIRREKIDSHTTVVVCVSSNDSGYEWGVIHSGRVQVESFMGYGCTHTAMRDALMYVSCGQVLHERSPGSFCLGKATAYVYPPSEQPFIEI